MKYPSKSFYSWWLLSIYLIGFIGLIPQAYGKSTPIGLVGQILQEEGGVKVVLKDVPFHNPANCTQTDYYFLDKSHPQYKENLSAILLAFTARYQVQFWINDLNCPQDYPMLSSTRIYPTYP